MRGPADGLFAPTQTTETETPFLGPMNSARRIIARRRWARLKSAALSPLFAFYRALLCVCRSLHTLLSHVCYLFALGRNPRSFLSWRSLMWFYANRARFERLCVEVPSPHTHTHPPLHTPTFFQACPLLRLLGEPLFMWDAFQIVVFVISLGHCYAERHASVTRDGFLLITHRLVRVPPEIQCQLHPLETASLALLCVETLARWRAEETRATLLAKTVSPSPPGSATRDTTAGGVSSGSGGDPFDLDGVSSACLLSPASEVRSRSVSSCLGEETASPTACLPSPRRLVVLQHGLLESSLNWVVGAYENDPLVAARPSLFGSIALHAANEWRQARRVLRNLARARSPFQGAGFDSLPVQTLEKALPFQLLALGHDVWLGNSRGNSFARSDWNRAGDGYHPPMGWREMKWHEFVNIIKIYRQNWTYNDMAVFDLEALQATISSVCNKPLAQLEPALIGFSQGAATFLLSTASAAGRSGWRPRALVLVSPPLITTRHYMSETPTSPKQPPQVKPSTSPSLSSTLASPTLSALASPLLFGRQLSAAVLSRVETLKRAGSNWIPLFFYLARHHLGAFAVFVECTATMAPTRVHSFLAQLTTHTALRFYSHSLPSSVAAATYKTTPSGITSQANMQLWLNRLETGEPVDFKFFQKFNEIHRLRNEPMPNKENTRREGGETADVTAVEQASKYCDIQVWLGAEDNISWPDRCVEYITERNENVEIWDIDYRTGRKRLLQSSRGDLPVAISVKLVQGKSHMDLNWSGDRQLFRDLASEINRLIGAT